MEIPFHYRNKAQFPFGKDKNGVTVTGFYAGRTHDIIANTDCALGVEQNQEILETILSFMEQYQMEPYDEKTGKGLLRHVLIRYGFTTKEIMVCLVINAKKIPHCEKLVELLQKIEGMTSITISVNQKNTNVIMGDSYEVLWGQAFITDYIGEIKYQISPLSFFQVNPVQTEKLYGLALEYADLKEMRRSGISTVESERYPCFWRRRRNKSTVWRSFLRPSRTPEKMRRSTESRMQSFMLEKQKRFCRDIMADYAKAHPGEQAHADVIVVDPPRKGCEESLLETMVQMQPERIVYVSCDSATLARDLKYLCGNGYELVKVRAVDQFSQTVHVESIVLLSRK